MTIDHCKMRDKIVSSGMMPVDIQEAVMERAGQIVTETISGKPSKVHKLPGVEVLARAVAQSVIEAGAARLAGDFNLSLDELKEHAAASHVSSC